MTHSNDKYPAHGKLREAEEMAVGYKATIYNDEGAGKYETRVVVTYKDLLSEFDQLLAEKQRLGEVLSKTLEPILNSKDVLSYIQDSHLTFNEPITEE